MYRLSCLLASLLLLTTSTTISAEPLLQPRQSDPSSKTPATTAASPSSTADPPMPSSLCTSLQKGTSNAFWYWIDIYHPSSTTSSPTTNEINNTTPATASTANTPGDTHLGQTLYHKLHPCNVTHWMPVTALGADGAYSVEFYTGTLQDKCVEDAVREAEGVVVVCGEGGEGGLSG